MGESPRAHTLRWLFSHLSARVARPARPLRWFLGLGWRPAGSRRLVRTARAGRFSSGAPCGVAATQQGGLTECQPRFMMATSGLVTQSKEGMAYGWERCRREVVRGTQGEL